MPNEFNCNRKLTTFVTGPFLLTNQAMNQACDHHQTVLQTTTRYSSNGQFGLKSALICKLSKSGAMEILAIFLSVLPL